MFGHLHLHTEYSQLDGYGNPNSYAKKAKELGQKFIAITDHGNIDGTLNFYNACLEQNITPIIGTEFYIVPDAKYKNKKKGGRKHLIALVKNNIGWKNLCKLITLSNIEGFYYKPRVDPDMVLKYYEGLIFLTGCQEGILSNNDLEDFFCKLKDKINDDLYLEVMPHLSESQIKLNEICCEMATVTGLKLIATNDCHYIEKDHAKIQEVMLAIQTKSKWNDEKRWKFEIDGLYLRSEKEMENAFKKQKVLKKKEYISAINNTYEIFKKCKDFKMQTYPISLPSIVKENFESKYIRKLCFKNFKEIFGEDIKNNKKYYERFKLEFDLIEKKGFVKYFLIVWDIINFCNENDIMTGPGRGSVGGSLFAYLLKITKVDPVENELLFSRFLSEDKVSLPDIDIDFEDSKRHYVIEYLQEKYGEDNIAGISTFFRMKGRSAIRDVSRVFDVPYTEVDEVAKTIEDDSVLEILNNSAGRAFKKKYPDIVDIATSLENTIRGSGRHAAGYIISNEPLNNTEKCTLVKKSNDLVVNWELDDAEKMGLLKLDILGLSTLSIINEAVNLIGKKIDFSKINLEDKEIINQFAKGNTVGIFQFNSYGMTSLLKRLNPDCYEDLCACNALFRPGTLRAGMVDIFVERKLGKKFEYLSDKIKIISEKTYGVIVYQEQAMKIAQQVAGFSELESDKMRKVISKSKGKEALEAFKDKFINGCIETSNFSKSKAEEFWHEFEEFGGYLFNRSHSFAYTMIGYWCMWLKINYPGEFICASLTYSSNQKKEELINEAHRLKLDVLLPKLELSKALKWNIEKNKLFVPFIEIKGIGEKTALILENKQKRKRQGFFRKQTGKKTKIDQIIEDIGADSNSYEIKESAKPYFSFELSENSINNLCEILGDDWLHADFSSILNGEITPECDKSNLIVKKTLNTKKYDCEDCRLRKECTKPIMPSKGIYNVLIIEESPGKIEDEKSKSLIGKPGELLWNKLNEYELKRRLFHISNICKCYPSESKKPSKSNIDVCKHRLFEEIKEIDCKLILAFGNAGSYCFLNSDSGITKLNGTTKFISKLNAWVCFCVSPSYALKNKSYLAEFDKGIENFVRTFNNFL